MYEFDIITINIKRDERDILKMKTIKEKTKKLFNFYRYDIRIEKKIRY